MLDPKASRFYQAALQSGLIDEAGLDECVALIPEEKRTSDAFDRRLARQTISSGRLTLWQAQQILGGRSNGFKIDKYVLLDLLGRGGMGRVYLARDVRLNRLVAFKILSQERMNNPRAIARFQREAKVGAQLQHENLVRVYDEGESGGVRYLVMEYIEGKNVGQLIGELGQIPWPTAARLGRQIALGLEHARLKELIHRDVNPCNILVTAEGSAKLTDLGLAIDLNEQDNVTRDGATVGTFDYVSPEQARHSRSVDTRTDIYSLGCTLYHMITGRVPFPVVSLPEKLYAHQLHDPEALTELAPDIPEGLSEVILRMMKKRPEERYQTPAEVAQALEPFAIASGWTSTPTTASSSSASSSGIGRFRPTFADNRIKSKTVEMGAVVVEAPSSWISSLHPERSGQPASVSGSDSRNPALGPLVAVQGGAGGVPTPSSNTNSDSFIPLDLGPEEPLSKGIKSSSWSRITRKPKSKGGDSASSDKSNSGVGLSSVGEDGASDGNASKQTTRRLILVASGVLGLVLLGAGGTWLFLNGSGGGTTQPVVAGKDKSNSNGSVEKINTSAANTTVAAKGPARGEIQIRYRDGSNESVKSLNQAIRLASSNKGADLILGDGTYQVDNPTTTRINSGGLAIKASPGTRPVIEFKIRGVQPLFLVNAPLKLEGLTIITRHDTPSEAVVFQVERELTFLHCVFRLEGPSEGSRFALAEGTRATVDGCLFAGFETGLDIEAPAGSILNVKHSIFLGPRSGEEATGRALRVHSLLGNGAGCRLIVQNCSARTGTFIMGEDFSPTTPLDLEVNESAFSVKSLLDLPKEVKQPLGTGATVRWKGKGNVYSIANAAWGNFENAPKDLESWSKRTSDLEGHTAKLKLVKEPPDFTNLAECGLIEDDRPVGANPAQVGPE